MKSFVSLAMIFLLSITYRGCSAPPTDKAELPSFSYEEELLEYAEDSANVKRDNFVNTEELESVINTDLDAVDQAIKEYTLDNVSPYYRVFFDPDTNVWKVVFNYYDEDLAKQAVYMNEKGKTLLIVYIE
ncbi:MAG: hypothetical protein E7587_06560 [Ruminococcaceae bacterium]|nr:hypothetical protein [Oscillospiraceae bacterium]